ncbi:MAG TPA: hypothetical protein PLB52_02515 [Candidatus Moranbacteria bacterium]|nr:hypothetical protein [Candidatus Moranbacteria bacterium]
MKATYFVGLVEHLHRGSSNTDYCIRNLQTNYLGGASSVETIASLHAGVLDKNFKEKITYEPQEEIDNSGAADGLCPKRYKKMSQKDIELFEKTVAMALREKK